MWFKDIEIDKLINFDNNLKFIKNNSNKYITEFGEVELQDFINLDILNKLSTNDPNTFKEWRQQAEILGRCLILNQIDINSDNNRLFECDSQVTKLSCIVNSVGFKNELWSWIRGNQKETYVLKNLQGLICGLPVDPISYGIIPMYIKINTILVWWAVISSQYACRNRNAQILSRNMDNVAYGYISLLSNGCWREKTWWNDIWYKVVKNTLLHSILLYVITNNSMCKPEKCVCNDLTFGDELNKQKENVLSILKNTNLFGTYGKCYAAISHVWGDNIMLNPILNKNVIKTLENEAKGKFWLDLVQDSFNADLCRQEYSGDVYIITQPLIYLPNNTPLNIILTILAISDWSRRGWIAQEYNSAITLKIVMSNGVINVSKEITESMFSTRYGSISQPKYLSDNTPNGIDEATFDVLKKRKWRKYEDIILTVKWWSIKPSVYERNKILPKWIGNNLFSTYKDDNYKGNGIGWCWLNISDGYAQGYNSDKVKLQLTELGELNIICLRFNIKTIINIVLSEDIKNKVKELQKKNINCNIEFLGSTNDNKFWSFICIKQITVDKWHVIKGSAFLTIINYQYIDFIQNEQYKITKLGGFLI